MDEMALKSFLEQLESSTEFDSETAGIVTPNQNWNLKASHQILHPCQLGFSSDLNLGHDG